MQLKAKSTSDLSEISKSLINFSEGQKIFLFYGDMGAGKTTFIKSLCRHLGVEGPTSSPTFSIVNEYAGAAGKIYHFDFYRLKNQTEALDMGYEEYFYSNSYCFVEWPEKISSLLPPRYIRVFIRVLNDNERLFNFQKI